MPFNQSFNSIELTSDLQLSWPFSFSKDPALCDKNEVTPSANGFAIFLPNAKDGARGSGGIFNNISNFSFALKAYEQATQIATIGPGQVVEVYLHNTSTNAAAWRVVSAPIGNNDISYLDISSSDESIIVQEGTVSPPGGSVDLKLAPSLVNLTKQINSSGFPVVTTVNPLNFSSVHLVAGDNISIANPNGVGGEPVISLSSSLSALASLEVGNITISGSIIDVGFANSDLSISTNGLGKAYLNGLSVDTSGNVSGINNLSISGKFISPYTISAWVNFTDTLITGGNIISIKSDAGVLSISGSGGTYKITSKQPFANINYAVLITPSSTDTSTPLVTHGYPILKTLEAVTIVVVDAGGEKVSSVPNGISVMIMNA